MQGGEQLGAQGLELIDAAYRLDVEDGAWLQRVADKATQALQVEGLAFAYSVANTRGELSIPRGYTAGFPEEAALAGIRATMESTPDVLRPSFFAPGTCALTASELTRKLAPHAGEHRVGSEERSLPVVDSIHIGGRDAMGAGIYFGALTYHAVQLAPRQQTFWNQIGSHVLAGHRLRRRLRSLDDATHGGEGHIAVIAPDGRYLEARGDGAEGNLRRELGAAARILERSRRIASRPDADTRVAYWADLVAGRFSLVHHEDRDGKRYYVAIENPPPARSLRALTAREREIVSHAIAGVPHKITAYALGITEPSVTRGLARALQKLGIPSRERLVDLAGRLGIAQLEAAADVRTHAA